MNRKKINHLISAIIGLIFLAIFLAVFVKQTPTKIINQHLFEWFIWTIVAFLYGYSGSLIFVTLLNKAADKQKKIYSFAAILILLIYLFILVTMLLSTLASPI
jgi:hypothetical protein